MVQLLTTSARALADILLPGASGRLLTAMCEKGSARSAEPATPAAAKTLENLSTTAAEILMAAPRGSIQRRVARAILTEGASKQLQQALVRQFDNKISLSAGASAIKAYEDYETMASGRILENGRHSRSRIAEDKVKSAVKFVLAPSNTSALSWGTREVRLSPDETITLPLLVRRMQVKDLYERYVATESSESRVGRSTFHRIVGAITAQSSALLAAADDVTGTLVHDGLVVLQDIVVACTSSNDEKEKFTTWLGLMRNFVKVQYGRHAAIEGDNVPTHGLGRALAKPDNDCASRDVQDVQDGHCDACAFVPWCFNQMRALVDRWDNNRGAASTPVDVEDARLVINDAEHKIELYQAHKVRVVNQHKAMADIEAELRRKVPAGGYSDTAILFMDYKMQSDKHAATATTPQQHGKTCMRWHGCGIAFFTLAGMKPGQPAKRMDVHLDQVVEGTNEPNVGTVVSLVEAALTWISANLPFASKVILQTDNAECFQSNELCLLIGLLNCRSPIRIERFVYAETQSGKSKLAVSARRGIRLISSCAVIMSLFCWVQAASKRIRPAP